MNNINDENLIKIINFWKQTFRNNHLFPRTARQKVDLNRDEVIAVIGPRRSGKSSFLQLIMHELPKDSWVYINFEDPFFIENKNADIIERLIDIYLAYFSSDLKYLFFDEIQNIENWEKVIRKYQETKKYKIFITGSSSQLLSKELATVLTGRHKTIKILPLDFSEFLSFNDFVFKKKADFTIRDEEIKKNFREYLSLGGFPKVVLDKRPEVLKQYFYDIIQKDIVGRYNIRQNEKLERLGNFLLSNIAKVYSVSALSKTFELSWEYVTLFISYFKEAFVLSDLVQFSYSLKTQEKSFNKIYSIDNGLVSAVSFAFSDNLGQMMENCAYNYFANRFDEIYYYKTASNSEVDFVLKNGKGVIGLIQICADISNEETRKREIKALLEGGKELNCKNLIVATYDFQSTENESGLEINYVPLYKVMLGLCDQLSVFRTDQKNS